MRIKSVALALVSLAAVGASSASAETITASFLQADGGVTTGLYDGTVLVTVSGSGMSLSNHLNDAFYLYNPENPPVHDSQFYQLTFGTSTLTPLNPAQDAVNFIASGLPAFSSSHSYTFDLNTGTSVLTKLHFGVSDGIFSDNSGAYTITVSQVAAVPEPSTWAMMIMGFAGVGFMAYRRRKDSTLALTAA